MDPFVKGLKDRLEKDGIIVLPDRVQQLADQVYGIARVLAQPMKAVIPLKGVPVRNVSVQKRVLFDAKKYDYSKELEDAFYGAWIYDNLYFVWSEQTVKIPDKREISTEPHERLTAMAMRMIRRVGPSCPVDRLKEPIPHTVKRVKTTHRWYGMLHSFEGQKDVSAPVCASEPERTDMDGVCEKTVWVPTAVVKKCLTVFEDAVYVEASEYGIAFYDRWFGALVLA